MNGPLIGRIVEDAYIVGKFLYTLKKAPKQVNGLGYASPPQDVPLVARAKWAWQVTTGGR